MESEEKKKAYNEYVERITLNNSLTKDMWNAFWIGGLICVMGQIWLELFMHFGMDKDTGGQRKLHYFDFDFGKCNSNGA